MPSPSADIHAIDYLILGMYMLGVLLIGTYFGRYIHSAGDLFLAGRALPFWAVGMSVVVSDIGATDMAWGAGQMFEFGLAQANFDWIGSMPACLIAAFVFVPFFWRSGVFTVPEFLGRRYNSGVRMIAALLWLAFMIAMLGIMMHASAVFLNKIMGIPYEYAVAGTAVVVGVYTITGGLTAVVMTDVLQMVVMFIGAGALLFLCLWEVGGWSGLREQLEATGAEGHLSLLLEHSTKTAFPWTGIIFGLGLVQATAYFVNNQAVIQRALGARSEWDAKAGMIFAGFLKVFIPLIIFVPGLAARVIEPEISPPETAVPYLMVKLLPPGLTGLMLAAFMAALMSSVDSYLNSSSTLFISDVYAPLHRRAAGGRPMSDRHGLVVGRTLTFLLIATAAATAPQFGRYESTIYNLIQTLMSLFQGPLLAIMALGILWPRATGAGAIVGLVGGVLFSVLLTLGSGRLFASEDPYLFVSFWSFLFASAATVLASLATRPPPEEKIRGLVFRQVLRDPAAQRALEGRIEQL
jgi:SSS family solute:Na+ symporter